MRGIATNYVAIVSVIVKAAPTTSSTVLVFVFNLEDNHISLTKLVLLVLEGLQHLLNGVTASSSSTFRIYLHRLNPFLHDRVERQVEIQDDL
jgi:hypothetical protein